MEQVIVGYLRQIGKLIIIDIHGKAFLYLLLDVVVHDSIRLTRAGGAEYH